MDIELIAFILLITAAIFFFFKGKRTKRLVFIDNYTFPSSLYQKVNHKHPHLTQEDISLVFSALKDYFHICNLANNRMVAMPSQVVDVAWHEFILFTRSYENFCCKALGKFLHHTPTEAMVAPTMTQTGLKRAWRLACAKEKINPQIPLQLPLLFAIDTQLNIPDGFKYSLDCKNPASPNYGSGYCAGHIGCTSGCAGDTGCSTTGIFFDGSCDSGSCGGGGCGGGD